MVKWCGRDHGAVLGLLLFEGGVLANGDQCPRFVPALAGIAQADIGVGADAQLFLDPVQPLFQPPQFAARWLYQQKQAASIAQLVGLVLGLGAADCGVGKSHLGATF